MLVYLFFDISNPSENNLIEIQKFNVNIHFEVFDLEDVFNMIDSGELVALQRLVNRS